jgi:hypothetical protein
VIAGQAGASSASPCHGRGDGLSASPSWPCSEPARNRRDDRRSAADI